jgi:hypothetical protein
MGLRASPAGCRLSPWAELLGDPEGVRKDFDKLNPNSLCEFAFQSGQFDAVPGPERLAGRLAPSVFALMGELSRIALRPCMWLFAQLSNRRAIMA